MPTGIIRVFHLELLNLVLNSNFNEAVFIVLLILSCTYFIRISILLSFVKIGLGLEGITGTLWTFLLTLSLSLLLSNPILNEVNNNLKDKSNLELKDKNFLVQEILRSNIIKKLSPDDYTSLHSNDVSQDHSSNIFSVTTAFILSEIKLAFSTGLKILLPFLIIDLLVAQIFTALGVVTLSAFSLSFALKVILLVSVGGWDLIIKNIIGLQ